MGFFNKLKAGLTKTRKNFVEKIETIVTGRKNIDEDLYDELEETLIQADVGIDTAVELIESLQDEVKKRKISDPEQLIPVLKELMRQILDQQSPDPTAATGSEPVVIMVVGVNGVGKTTTIGKLAHMYKQQGHQVLLGAADTFRAAAIDQLEIWGRRVDAPVVKHSEGADPAAVAFDALQAARARKMDYVIIDTAGRLHTKSNLMDELKKVRRVLNREMPEAPHQVLLVVDATTGQNAISQVALFKEAVGVTDIALTKLDGTAKGGVVLAVKQALGIPITLIGVGEGIDDLRPFNPQDFLNALFEKEDAQGGD